MSSLFFTQPFLLALLVIPLLMWLRVKKTPVNKSLRTFADPHLWPWIIRNPDADKSSLRNKLFIIATTLAILAAAGPTYIDTGSDTGSETNKRSGNDIVLLVDISSSMSVTDVLPNRLQRAKLELNTLLPKLAGNRIGLIVFSSQAYTILPLTHDLKTVQTFIAALDTGLSRFRGSQLSDALDEATNMLEHSKAGSRAVILVTDGDIHDTKQSLSIARQMGREILPIFILSTGTTYGGPVMGPKQQFISHQGKLVTSRLNADFIEGLANNSHGMSTPGHNDGRNTEMILTAVRTLAKANHYSTTAAAMPRALYPWLLAISLLLFMYLGMQRFSGLALLCVLAPGLMLDKEASAADLSHYLPWNEQRAYQALQKGDYKTALNIYSKLPYFNAQMGAGAAAYRSEKWPLAEKYFRHAMTLADTPRMQARTLYNIGNTLLHSQQYGAARTAYQQALELDPQFKNAIVNLRLINTVSALDKQAKQNKPTHQTAITKRPGDDKQNRFSNELPGNMPPGIDDKTTQRVRQQLIDATIKKWYPKNNSLDSQLLAAQHQARGIQTLQTPILQQRINRADQRNTPTREKKPW